MRENLWTEDLSSMTWESLYWQGHLQPIPGVCGEGFFKLPPVCFLSGFPWMSHVVISEKLEAGKGEGHHGMR